MKNLIFFNKKINLLLHSQIVNTMIKNRHNNRNRMVKKIFLKMMIYWITKKCNNNILNNHRHIHQNNNSNSKKKKINLFLK